MRAALIGAGSIARQHLGCLKNMRGVDLAGVCDLSAATAEAAAERHGVREWFTDHRVMLEKVRPHVVHVTTPPTSYFQLAMAALDAGAHVIVEKPATSTFEELEALTRRAEQVGRVLVENHNYVFNAAPLEIARRIESGELGAVTHVEARVCLDILGSSGFADPNSPHPALELAGGAIAEFLPHLASLAHRFVGPHRTAHTVWTKRKDSVLPFDEFQAVVEGERGTASLGFSASAQPDAFWLRVYGEKMQATANLFETRLTFDGPRPVPRPLRALVNGIDEGSAVQRAAIKTFFRKFKGPCAYEGLWELLGRVYQALDRGAALPITTADVLAVNRLVEDLKPRERRT